MPTSHIDNFKQQLSLLIPDLFKVKIDSHHFTSTHLDFPIAINFLASKQNTSASIALDPYGEYTAKITFNASQQPVEIKKIDEFKREYNQFQTQWKKIENASIQQIIEIVKRTLPDELQKQSAADKLMRWDPKKRQVFSDFGGILKEILRELKLREFFLWTYLTDPNQYFVSVLALYPTENLKRLIETLISLPKLSAESKTKYCDMLVNHVQTYKSSLTKTYLPTEHERHAAYATVLKNHDIYNDNLTLENALSFNSQQFVTDLLQLNETHYHTHSEFTGGNRGENYDIGFAGVMGNRTTQEDAFATAITTIEDFPKLNQVRQKQAFLDCYHDLQSKWGNRPKVGTAATTLITWCSDTQVHFALAYVGNVTAYICQHNRESDEVKLTPLTVPHLPDKERNEYEYNRVIEYCREHKAGFDPKGHRLGSGLAYSRCLGNTESENFGLSHIPSVRNFTFDVNPKEDVYGIVMTKGIESLGHKKLAEMLIELKNKNCQIVATNIALAARDTKIADSNASIGITYATSTPTCIHGFDGHGYYIQAYEMASAIKPILCRQIDIQLEGQSIELQRLQSIPSSCRTVLSMLIASNPTTRPALELIQQATPTPSTTTTTSTTPPESENNLSSSGSMNDGIEKMIEHAAKLTL